MEFTISPKRATRFLLSIGFILALASIVTQFIKYFVVLPIPNKISTRVFDLLNVDQENNIPTFYAAILLLFSAGLLFLIDMAERKTAKNFSFYWRGLSIIFIYLAMDELFQFHEAINEIILQNLNLHIPGRQWEVLGLFLVAIFVASYAQFFWKLPRKIRRICFISAVLFLIGAAVIEFFGVHLFPAYYHQPIFLGEIITTIEETLEITGICVFIYGLLLYFSAQVDYLHWSLEDSHIQDKSGSLLIHNKY